MIMHTLYLVRSAPFVDGAGVSAGFAAAGAGVGVASDMSYVCTTQVTR